MALHRVLARLTTFTPKLADTIKKLVILEFVRYTKGYTIFDPRYKIIKVFQRKTKFYLLTVVTKNKPAINSSKNSHTLLVTFQSRTEGTVV